MTSYNLGALREEDVQAFVTAGLQEGHRLDYKGCKVPEDLEHTVAAMVNTEGGSIVLGVEEKQGVPQRVIGMTVGRDDLLLRLQQRILSNVSPKPTFRIGIALMRDDPTRVVGIIEVDQGDHPPYASHQTHFRVRRGSQNVPATINDIEQLIARRGRRQQRVHEVMSNFLELPVEPCGGLANEDTRRYLRLQVDVAPVSPLNLVIDSQVEACMREAISESFRWTDSSPRIVDRDVDSVEFVVDHAELGSRHWTARASGHVSFATPVVHGGVRESAMHVFLTDVAVDLMRALAWSARISRQFGASGRLVVGGTLWVRGCTLENDSRTRVQRLDAGAAALAGVNLGAERSINPRLCTQLVPIAELESASGAAAAAAEILRTALRSQFRAEIDLAALIADLRAREADSFPTE